MPRKVSSASTKECVFTEPFLKVKFLVGIDDALDLFAEHAVGGIVGLFCNGLFATRDVIALDGVNTAVAGGWWDLVSLHERLKHF